MTTPSNDPQRPPKGPAGVSTPLPPVILVQPEIIAALDRLAVSIEGLTAAIVPDDDGGAVEAEYCGAPIFYRGRRADAFPLVCTRFAGHDPGHVARDTDGTVIVCQLGRPPAAPIGFVCPACGETPAVHSG
ncbi:hypothetical protein [Promicromonospora sp. NPDC023805]|uniref:hypothetical protein n=1 Tax=Promicromonospora sp. NPDC023805 TaxID=3154696 RepID=UPI0033C93424